MRTMLVMTVAAAIAIGPAGHGAAAPAGKIQICGQKKGPAASWSDSIPGVGMVKFKGSTWTVIATDVSCAYALKVTPGHLARWSKAKIGDHWRSDGWFCGKEKGKGYSGSGVSSGSIGCVGPKTQFIAIKMYAPYTLAQIKAIAKGG
jgi:hypothetical protein